MTSLRRGHASCSCCARDAVRGSPRRLLALRATRASAQPVPTSRPTPPAAADGRHRRRRLRRRRAATPTERSRHDRAPALEPPDDASTPTELVSLGADDRGFRFGSYGRVIAGTDLRGGKPEKILVVAHGPRIVEDSYLELDFVVRLRDARAASKLRPVDHARVRRHAVPRHRRVRRAPRAAQHVPRRDASRQRPHAVGRLADVPRRRHLPVRLLAARRSEHRRRRRVLSARGDTARRRRARARGARRRQSPRRSVPVPADRGRRTRRRARRRSSSSTASA